MMDAASPLDARALVLDAAVARFAAAGGCCFDGLFAAARSSSAAFRRRSSCSYRARSASAMVRGDSRLLFARA
jgi:hypothetical protein